MKTHNLAPPPPPRPTDGKVKKKLQKEHLALFGQKHCRCVPSEDTTSERKRYIIDFEIFMYVEAHAMLLPKNTHVQFTIDQQNPQVGHCSLQKSTQMTKMLSHLDMVWNQPWGNSTPRAGQKSCCHRLGRGSSFGSDLVFVGPKIFPAQTFVAWLSGLRHSGALDRGASVFAGGRGGGLGEGDRSCGEGEGITKQRRSGSALSCLTTLTSR